MSFRNIFYGGGGVRSPVGSGSKADGVIYAIAPNGHLFWYQDVNRHGQNGPNAERGWAAGSGNQIGKGWNNLSHVFSGGDGIIYAVTQDGRLLWYRDDDRQGNNGPNAERGWAAGSGNQIHFGWFRFTHVFGVGGNIYAIKADGRLLWYQDSNRQGGNDPGGLTGWAAGSGNQINQGWNDFTHVFGGGTESPTISEEGGIIIYAVAQLVPIEGRVDSGLFWYRDADIGGRNAPNGSTGWSSGSGNQIGKGW